MDCKNCLNYLKKSRSVAKLSRGFRSDCKNCLNYLKKSRSVAKLSRGFRSDCYGFSKQYLNYFLKVFMRHFLGFH